MEKIRLFKNDASYGNTIDAQFGLTDEREYCIHHSVIDKIINSFLYDVTERIVKVLPGFLNPAGKEH